MQVVMRLVSAFMSATWARHDVIGVQNTFTFCQVGEEEDPRCAFLAYDDDIPRPSFGLNHGGTTFLSGSKTLVQGCRTRMASQFCKLKRQPDLAACGTIVLPQSVRSRTD